MIEPKRRTPIFYRDAVRRDIHAVVVIDRPNVIYINLLGDLDGVILLLCTL